MKGQTRSEAFTLIETLVAFGVFALVTSGVIYGYVQTNRLATFSSLSLAAQSYATQGAESARAAAWRPRDFPQTYGPGGSDELPPTNIVFCGINYILDVPIKGSPASSDFAFFVTNYVSVANVSSNPPLRQIRSDAVWKFFLTGQTYTNTQVLLRAPDQ
jgi:type II secretory pathway pseudopilin PulG